MSTSTDVCRAVMENVSDYDDQMEVERLDFHLHSISLPQHGLSPSIHQKNNFLTAEAWLNVRGEDLSHMSATTHHLKGIQHRTSSLQHGKDIPSTMSSSLQYGQDIPSTTSSPPQHGKDIPSTTSSVLQHGKDIPSTTSSPLQHGKDIPSTTSSPQQHGTHIPLTRPSALRQGKDISLTTSSTRLHHKDRLPRTSSPIHHETTHQFSSMRNQSPEGTLRTSPGQGNVKDASSICSPDVYVDTAFPRCFYDNQKNPIFHKSAPSLGNSGADDGIIENTRSKCRSACRLTSANKTVRNKIKTRFTESAVETRSRLLYLRENGVCARTPSVETITYIDNDSNASQHNKGQRLFQRIVRSPHTHSSTKDRLNRAVSAGVNQWPGEGKRPLKASENRKQKYLDEILQDYMDRRSSGTRGFGHILSKPRSAPQLRNNINNSNTADKDNTSKSDHLIKLFEWSKMAHLRTRISGEITPAMLQFRDKVKQKSNRAKRLLLVVTRIFLAIQHWSAMKTIRTAAELQWFTLNSSTEAKTLAFNKELFTKDRAQAKVPEWAIRAMGKLPGERTESECRRLHALMRGLKSFEKFTERIQLAMCRSLRYENIDSMRIILRKGHIGLNFYFIYSGSVFINVDDVNAKGETFVKTEVVLSRGDAFGELALLQEVARTATVSARETCELLTVDKEVFSKLCPQIFDKELEEKIEFMKRVPLFQSRWWPSDAVRNICFQAHIQEYKTNRIIVSDSTKDDWMYICMTGKCKIIRHLHLRSAEDDVAEETSDEDDVKEQMLNLLSADDRDEGKYKGSRRASVIRRKSLQKDKVRLLQSMSLAYVDSKQRSYGEKPSGKEEGSVGAVQALTLSSLISQTEKHVGENETVFLDIGTLNKGEVFDLESILDRKLVQTNSKLILVSGGASLIRFKRSMFFQNANEECLQHAHNVASKLRYPSDHALLRSYKEKALWDHYKHRVVRETLASRLDEERESLDQATGDGQTEVERRTKRLLLAFSQRSSSVSGPSDSRRTCGLAVGIHKLGAFILGTASWGHAQNSDSAVAEGRGLASSQSIPTITIS